MQGKKIEIIRLHIPAREQKESKFNITDRFRQTWGPNRSVTEQTEDEKIRRANRL